MGASTDRLVGLRHQARRPLVCNALGIDSAASERDTGSCAETLPASSSDPRREEVGREEDCDDPSDARARRPGGPAHVVCRWGNRLGGRAGLRPERADLRPQHVDEPDPGDGRRDRQPAGLQPVRDAALRAAVQARHLRHPPPTRSTSRSATTPPSPASACPRTTSSSTGRSTSATSAPVGSCVALNNFWRSLSNLTINVTTPDFGCYTGEFWAVSQAAPMRRVHVNGLTDADGLLHRPVVRERRLHRRFAVRRQHRDQRLAAAVAGQEQHARRLDQRRLEPGVLGRRGRARPVLPGAGDRAAARTPRSRRAR